MLPTIFRELSSLGAEVYWAEWDIYISGQLMAAKASPTPYVTSPITNEVFSEHLNVWTSLFFVWFLFPYIVTKIHGTPWFSPLRSFAPNWVPD